MTILFEHESCLRHDMGEGHPERPDRLRAIQLALAESEFVDLERRSAPLATLQQIALVHPQTYINHIFDTAPKQGRVQLDPDTAMNSASLEAARRAARYS